MNSMYAYATFYVYYHYHKHKIVYAHFYCAKATLKLVAITNVVGEL